MPEIEYEDGMRLLRTLRKQVEKFPLAAEVYRHARDYAIFRFGQPKPTPLGIVLMGNESAIRGEYERAATEVITGRFAQTDVFVDVGANIGYYTCLARAAGVTSIAVEPSQKTLRLLCRNLDANNFIDVEVHPVGLSDSIGIVKLHGAEGTASILAEWSRSTYAERIPTSTLDTLLGDRFADRRLFIKIDVEGHEYAALSGASRTLARELAPTWFVEIYLQGGHAGGNRRFLDTFQLFWDRGYIAREALPDGRVVDRETVERWVREGKTDRRNSNYLFEQRLATRSATDAGSMPSG